MLKAAQIVCFLSESTATYVDLLLKLAGAWIIAVKVFICSISLYKSLSNLGLVRQASIWESEFL